MLRASELQAIGGGGSLGEGMEWLKGTRLGGVKDRHHATKKAGPQVRGPALKSRCLRPPKRSEWSDRFRHVSGMRAAHSATARRQGETSRLYRIGSGAGGRGSRGSRSRGGSRSRSGRSSLCRSRTRATTTVATTAIAAAVAATVATVLATVATMLATMATARAIGSGFTAAAAAIAAIATTVATMTLEQAAVATLATAATIAAAARTTVATVVATGDSRLFAAQQGETDNRDKSRDAQN